MANAEAGTGLMNLQFVTVETFVIQFVILIIVLWVLNKFIFRPYLAYLDEWEEKQEKVQQDYNNAEAILDEKRAQGDEMLENARNTGNSLIEEAESLANAKRDKIITDAENAATETAKIAEGQIAKERQSMLSGVKTQVMDMTIRLNEKLFKDAKVSKDFVEKHIDSLK